MLKAKKTVMYIDVKGVDDMTDRRDLMRERSSAGTARLTIESLIRW